jgi:transaldolase
VQIFLDSGDIKQIKKWLPFVDGLTTNPTILKKDGYSIEQILKELPEGFPVSLEAVYPFEEKAKELAKLGTGVYVKIPLLNGDGSNNLEVIKRLSDEGISVNCTALFSLGQVILASKAGADFVSLFGGRIEDEGGDQFEVIRLASDFLFESQSDSQIIFASVRQVSQIAGAQDSGAHIVTIPPAILEKMLMHWYSKETSAQFERDARG